jgi:hypothetical protein
VGVDVPGRVDVEIEDVNVVVLALEVRVPEVGQHLGADGGGPVHEGELDHRREGEAARRPAGHAPGQVGDAGPGALELLGRLAQRRPGEDRDLDPAARPLLDLLRPRHDDVLVVIVGGRGEVGQLELELLGEGGSGRQPSDKQEHTGQRQRHGGG